MNRAVTYNILERKFLLFRISTRLLIILLLGICTSVSAKSYDFNIDSERSEITAYRSSAPGTKMVKVVSYGSSSDEAIDKAMLDLVVDATFFGIKGNEFIDNIPPLLFDGLNGYNEHRKFFDKFFKKGEFIKYVSMVNSTYPTGTNNVSTPKGRKVTIYLIVDLEKLDKFYRLQKIITKSSLLLDL